MRIFDCFIAVDEYPMMAARVAELADCGYPVTHLAVEAGLTTRGDLKPYILSDVPPPGVQVHRADNSGLPGPWEREKAQRDYLFTVLARHRPDPDDMVILGDADEIPRGSAVERMVVGTTLYPMRLAMRMHHWSPAWVDPAMIASTAVFRWKDRPESPTTFRGEPLWPGRYVAEGGWHLTWFGGLDACCRKLRTFAHHELDTPEVHAHLPALMAEGRSINGYPLAAWDGSDMPRGLT